MSANIRLATYGTLAPGKVNHHQLEALRGEWFKGIVHGKLVNAGWGAAKGCPGIIFSEKTDAVTVHIFQSENLPAHWERLDAFEGDGYRRVEVVAETPQGALAVSIYEVIVSSIEVVE